MPVILHSDRKHFKLRSGNLDTGLQVKKTVKYSNVFLESSCKDIQNIKRDDEVIAEKMGLTQTMLERMENMLKWYAHVVSMADNRWHKRILTWPPGETRRRGRTDTKWKKEEERVMKWKNLTSDDAVERQVWRGATEK